VLWLVGPAGLATRIEQFDVGHEAEALARFEELSVGPAPARPPRRRVRPNAASEHAARLNAAMAARNVGALPTLFADQVEGVDHATGTTSDREGVLFSLGALLRARDPTFRQEPLATLGDTLALMRASWSASGLASGKFDVAAYEGQRINVVEVDAEGRFRLIDLFAVDRMGDAIVRLYERYAELLPDGAERKRIAATARSVGALAASDDLGRYAGAFAPCIEAVDHRILGTWSACGADALLEHFRSFLALVEGATIRADDVLALRSDAHLVRWTNSGTDRAGGGAYERPFLAVAVYGADGLATRIEWFDADRDAEALARFDQLVPSGAGETTRVVRFENAATQAFGRGFDACRARDWARFATLFAPGFRGIDRRRMLRTELDRDEWLVSYRAIVEMTSPQSTREVLATRGDRLMLGRYRWQGTDGIVGPSEIEYLMIIEVDGRGDHVAVVMFDPDAVDAAYTELDERYATGEAAPHARTWEAWLDIVRAIAARNWTRLAAVFAPGFVLEDHRPVALFGSWSRDEYVASARALADLRPDVRFRVDHAVALDDGLSLNVAGWVGDEADGAFETLQLVVTEHGSDGIRRWHVYDLDRFDAARACYDALAANAPPRVENAATRLTGRFTAAWAARDWEGLAALFAPGFRLTDRRRYAQVALDRDRHLESLRFRFEMRSSSTTLEVLATRGQRLALVRQRFELADGDVGPSETESVNVAESDEHARFATLVTFDPEDLDAAYAELDRRYAAESAA
jgi:hypothetical protein